MPIDLLDSWHSFSLYSLHVHSPPLAPAAATPALALRNEWEALESCKPSECRPLLTFGSLIHFYYVSVNEERAYSLQVVQIELIGELNFNILFYFMNFMLLGFYPHGIGRPMGPPLGRVATPRRINIKL